MRHILQRNVSSNNPRRAKNSRKGKQVEGRYKIDKRLTDELTEKRSEAIFKKSRIKKEVFSSPLLK